MRQIWKYPLKTVGVQELEVPSKQEWLCVQMQREVPTLWAIVDPNSPKVKTTIIIHGTGHPIEEVDYLKEFYIGTYQEKDGYLVWHVFEILEEE